MPLSGACLLPDKQSYSSGRRDAQGQSGRGMKLDSGVAKGSGFEETSCSKSEPILKPWRKRAILRPLFWLQEKRRSCLTIKKAELAAVAL
jgi:hypothetical protein